MRVNLRKLPPHWKYLLTPRQSKALVGEVSAEVRVIEFCGTASKPYFSWTAGRIDAQPSQEHWCYRISVIGLPERILLADFETAREFFSDAIQSFILDRNNEAVMDVTAPVTRWVSYREESGQLKPSVSDKRRDLRDTDRVIWWLPQETATT